MIKAELNYAKEVAPKLDSLMDEVEELAKNSKLPLKADKKFWDNFIIETIINKYFNPCIYCYE